jgi:hypothetical protein
LLDATELAQREHACRQTLGPERSCRETTRMILEQGQRNRCVACRELALRIFEQGDFGRNTWRSTNRRRSG